MIIIGFLQSKCFEVRPVAPQDLHEPATLIGDQLQVFYDDTLNGFS